MEEKSQTLEVQLIMTKKKDADESQNEKGPKSNDNSDPEDYQLSRAFDLILALTLINNKTIQ